VPRAKQKALGTEKTLSGSWQKIPSAIFSIGKENLKKSLFCL
jgi:hypothetical protein